MEASVPGSDFDYDEDRSLWRELNRPVRAGDFLCKGSIQQPVRLTACGSQHVVCSSTHHAVKQFPHHAVKLFSPTRR
jgi:hypothetical protein